MTEEQAEELAAMAYKLGFEKGQAGVNAQAGDAQAEALKAQEQAAEAERANVLAGLEAKYASLMHAKNFPQALLVNAQIKALKAKQ